jgi:flagellar biosynthesis/type III secretory pathway M-ring protein FliF/YscJ
MQFLNETSRQQADQQPQLTEETMTIVIATLASLSFLLIVMLLIFAYVRYCRKYVLRSDTPVVAEVEDDDVELKKQDQMKRYSRLYTAAKATKSKYKVPE